MTSLRTKYNLEKYDEENPEILIEGLSENKTYQTFLMVDQYNVQLSCAFIKSYT